MFSEKLVKNQPFVTKFFESAIKTKNSKFAHAYMFTGGNIYDQYLLSLETAKALNCSSIEKSSNCSCTNCNWINENRHPAVITISPVDFTFDSNGNKVSSSTVIKVDQTRYLRNRLAISSNYHRAVIFTNAIESKDLSTSDIEMHETYKDFLYPPQNDFNEKREIWVPLPLTYKVFNTEAANTLLKTIEEPSSNVTFFFLTRDKEDIIETIVSRCQIIPVLSSNIKELEIFLPEEFKSAFPPKNYENALWLSEKLIDFSKQKSIGINVLLDYIQEYLKKLIKFNSNDKRLVSIFIDYISKIEEAKIRLINYVNPQSVLDSLFMSFLRL